MSEDYMQIPLAHLRRVSSCKSSSPTSTLRFSRTVPIEDGRSVRSPVPVRSPTRRGAVRLVTRIRKRSAVDGGRRLRRVRPSCQVLQDLVFDL